MLTLHEEIAIILKEQGRAFTTKEIANLVNRRGNYKKKDGSPITDFQIHGRTKNYPRLFERQGSIVILKNHNTSNYYSEAVTSIEESTVPEALVLDKEDDVSSIEFLKKAGFNCIGTLGNLIANGLSDIEALRHCGLYGISKPADYEAIFLSLEDTISRNNVISPWDNDALTNKWVEDSDILYFGIAGKQSPRTLKERLGDLLQHCKGETTDRGPHKGGEIIWQLKGYENFLLWILPMDFSQGTRVMEEKLLRKFFADKGKLPFANRQF